MRRFAPVLTLLIAAALVAGCGKGSNLTDPSPYTTPDQAEVSSELSANPEYVDDGVSESEDLTEASAEVAAALAIESSAQAVHPINFWRRIEEVRRGFEFAFGDTDSTGRPTRAVVTVRKQLSGSFNVLVAPPHDSVLAGDVIHKRLRDAWTRRILLQRVRVPESPRPQWRIVATTGVEVVSEGATTDLVSLRVQSDGGLDTTITDPLAFFHLRRVLRFAPEDSIRLTATTLRSDDVVVLMKHDRRFRFRNNGDNTYTGVFRAALLMRVGHVGVNALSRGSLYDDQAPYDSEAWILPYVSRTLELAYLDD